MIDKGAFDVILISRHHLSKTYLGISRAVDQVSDILLTMGLSVCILAEGETGTISNKATALTIITVPSQRIKLKSMFVMGIPHPVAAWLLLSREYLDLAKIVISPVVGLQSLIFKKSGVSGNTKIITLFTPYSKYSLLGLLYFRLQKKSLENAEIVIGNSRTILQKFSVKESDGVFVIPNLNSIPIEFKEKNQNKEYDLVWIGTLTFRKGIDRLLYLLVRNKGRKSIQVIWSKGRFSAFFLFVLRAFEKRNWCNLISNIPDSQFSEILSKSKILLSTTRFESFGMTLVEAASLGVGTVGISAPGIVETITESSKGALYFQKLSELANYLKNDDLEEMSLNLGKNAQEFVKTRYSESAVSNYWRTIISKKID
jgi:glycosyltransferase involved in cell wall biosynthesis